MQYVLVPDLFHIRLYRPNLLGLKTSNAKTLPPYYSIAWQSIYLISYFNDLLTRFFPL